jgi:transposase|tara:strand:+ start:83 stop:1438 length:1356 start_codon:yes stop_codon:yes gene_type:complete
MSNFRQCDRNTAFLLPPSVDDWLPEDHLARFVVDIVDQLDLSTMTGQYRGSGKAAYHPSMLLALLIYGYATGIYSSRRIESASYESLAFRYIAANTHPDHDTLCTFRKRFLKEIEALFVQVLGIAKEMNLLQLGTVALDGTKVHANASRHSALSYGHAEKLEGQLQAEVRELLARAEAADAEPLPEGLNIPEELARRDVRLDAIKGAKAEIEARAAERFAREQAEYEAKVKAREDKQKRTGKKPRGKPPTAPTAGPRAKDQVNLTDPDSRIMPGPGGGFEQSYNTQAAVDTDTMLVIASGLTQAANDKQQLEPMLEVLGELPEDLGSVTQMLADAGYFSEANVTACLAASIEPLLAVGRESHHVSWQERFGEPASLAEPADAVADMRHRLKTRAGRADYGLRKQTVEPVFGIIKSVMQFRQFLLRGFEAVSGEWSLVTMAWNIRRMAVLRG